MKRICFLAIIWGGIVGSLNASEISYAPLTNIVKQAVWIIKARVLTVDRKDTLKANRVEYLVAPTTVLRGIQTTPHQVKLDYSEYIPVIKDAEGKPIGWASPIYSGSGNEFAVKVDEEWIMVTRKQLGSSILSLRQVPKTPHCCGLRFGTANSITL